MSARAFVSGLDTYNLAAEVDEGRTAAGRESLDPTGRRGERVAQVVDLLIGLDAVLVSLVSKLGEGRVGAVVDGLGGRQLGGVRLLAGPKLRQLASHGLEVGRQRLHASIEVRLDGALVGLRRDDLRLLVRVRAPGHLMLDVHLADGLGECGDTPASAVLTERGLTYAGEPFITLSHELTQIDIEGV